MEELKRIEKVLKENNNIVNFTTKLQIVEFIDDLGFTGSEELKRKTLDFIYSFWMQNDLFEHTLFDLCSLIIFEKKINISQMNYEEFEKNLLRLI